MALLPMLSRIRRQTSRGNAGSGRLSASPPEPAAPPFSAAVSGGLAATIRSANCNVLASTASRRMKRTMSSSVSLRTQGALRQADGNRSAGVSVRCLLKPAMKPRISSFDSALCSSHAFCTCSGAFTSRKTKSLSRLVPEPPLDSKSGPPTPSGPKWRERSPFTPTITSANWQTLSCAYA
jgi:hypothetical protein